MPGSGNPDSGAAFSAPVPPTLARRTAVGAVVVAASLAAVALGPPAVFLAVAAIALGAGWEAARLLSRIHEQPVSLPTALGPVLVLMLLLRLDPQVYPAYLPVAAGVGFLLIRLGRGRRQPGLTRAGAGVLAASYASLIGFLYLLDLAPTGAGWLMVVLVATWSNDSLAYLVGSAAGRHRLAPGISPRKSWEGAVAGWLTAVLAGGLLGLTMLGPGPAAAAAVGLLVALSGTAGDLLESWLKRRAGAKDSGEALPGHGGVLDRVDSLLAAGPLAYLVLLSLGRL